MKKRKVLFLCTNNSVRSQMAEGILRHFGNELYEVFSAGTKPTELSRYAVEVMKEIGIDISNQESKSVDVFLDKHFDYVVTLCNSAKEECPLFFNGKIRIHKSFKDPLAGEGKIHEKEVFENFRILREQILKWVKETFLV